MMPMPRPAAALGKRRSCSSARLLHRRFKVLLPTFAVALTALASPAATSTPGWSLVWSDEFEAADGSAPDTAKWAFDRGGNGWGNNELQTYTDRRQNSRIESGRLILEARKETFTGSDGISRSYTSARLKTLALASWTLGRVEARIKVPRGNGLWPAFWMLGTNFPTAGWPACGEIDIMEHIGRQPAKAYGTIHGPGYSGGSGIGGSTALTNAVADEFHLFAVEWEAARIRWFLDNRLYFTAAPSSLPSGAAWVFNKPQFILLNVAVGGNWPGNPDATTVFPQRMEVDFVRVYARTNTSAAMLHLRRADGQVEVSWSGEFPHGRLLTQANLGQVWRDVPLLGSRRADWFCQPATPGFYRLAWLP
jgi:beta-glucanase (GH16 family)